LTAKILIVTISRIYFVRSFEIGFNIPPTKEESYCIEISISKQFNPYGKNEI
jgi:hypothetical protein